MSDHGPQEKKKEEYMRNIGRVNTWVSTGLENGLFKIQSDVSYEEIREKLRKAGEYLEKRGLSDKPDFVQSGYELDLAAKKRAIEPINISHSTCTCT